MDLAGELLTDLFGDQDVDPEGEDSISFYYFFLKTFLRRKQLFAQGSLSCIINIREKNISDDTMVLIREYSS